MEEDIDDGTFTTVYVVQLQGEFKRLGMEDLESMQGECDAIKAYLKTRIRDLKRIFTYYAASGIGNPITISPGEYPI